MELRVFVRGHSNVISLTPAARKAVAESMGAAAAALCQGNDPVDALFPVLSAEVTFFGERWGEKWVENMGQHLFLYSAGGTPNLSPGSVPSAVGNWRHVKSLSGDVSGAIGETLFALLMRRLYGLRSRSFAHLRAQKSMSFPDFEIIYPSPSLQAAMKAVVGRSPRNHFPAEVKGISLPDEKTIAQRSYKALSQINSYWTERGLANGTLKRPPDGLIALVVRNVAIQRYDIVLYAVT